MAYGDAREGKWRGNWRMEWKIFPPFISAKRLSELPLPCVTVCHHISTRLYRSLSAERLSERTVHKHSCKVPVSLTDFNEFDFFGRFSKNPQISNFTKFHSVGAELLHADRRTDMMKLTVAFRNFAKTRPNFSETNKILWSWFETSVHFGHLYQCFSTAGPRPGTGPWHQLDRAARGSPGICHFSFPSNFHE